MVRTPYLYTVIFNSVPKWKLKTAYVCFESDNSNRHNSLNKKNRKKNKQRKQRELTSRRRQAVAYLNRRR